MTRRLKATLGIVALVALMAAAIALALLFTGSRSIYTDGLTSNQPTETQMTVMATYFRHEYGPTFWGARSTARYGCAVHSMATRPIVNGLISYAQVECQTCPPDQVGGLLPAVFQVGSTSVESLRAATAISDPSFYQQVRALFPRQLWSMAHSQQFPKSDGLISTALQEAAC